MRRLILAAAILCGLAFGYFYPPLDASRLYLYPYWATNPRADVAHYPMSGYFALFGEDSLNSIRMYRSPADSMPYFRLVTKAGDTVRFNRGGIYTTGDLWAQTVHYTTLDPPVAGGSPDTFKRGLGMVGRGTWAKSGESLAVDTSAMPHGGGGVPDTLLRGYGLQARGTWTHAGESLAVNDTVIPTFTDMMDSIAAYAGGSAVIAGWGIDIHGDSAGHDRVSADSGVFNLWLHGFHDWQDSIARAKGDSGIKVGNVALDTAKAAHLKNLATVLADTALKIRGNKVDTSTVCTGQAATVASISGHTADAVTNGVYTNVVAAHTAQYYATEISDSCSSGGATINLAASNTHRVKLNSGANTLTLSNGAAGGRYLLVLKQPSSGAAGTVTFSPVPLWSYGTAPTFITTNSGIDLVTLYYSGVEAKYLGGASLDMR